MRRRDFLHTASGLGACLVLGSPGTFRAGVATPVPKLTFCGATRQVSGSCHLIETSKGLFLVDCGRFFRESGVADPQKENVAQFPFDPKEIKAVFLTHAHTDHNGRLPLLYERGFRGPIYCTDCTRDLTQVMLSMDFNAAEKSELDSPFYRKDSIEAVRWLTEAIPYNTKLQKHGLTFRYTDAGHILGSAMVELWADGHKLLFSGDIGNDNAPIVCKPTQHFVADVIVVESTYGGRPRDSVSFESFGQRVNAVLTGGGSVLLPANALHKTQILVYLINRLKQQGILDPKVPVYADSPSAQKITKIYHQYTEYYDPDATRFGDLFYQDHYFEPKGWESLASHGKEPAIYLCSSGNLDHAAAPRRFLEVAEDPKNAIFFVGYQNPGSLGRKVCDSATGKNGEDRVVMVPIEEPGQARREVQANVRLAVERAQGFSSHATGQQILEWFSRFRSAGDVYVVHGEPKPALSLVESLTKMGLNARAPLRLEQFAVTQNPQKPDQAPQLQAEKADEPAPVDK